MLPLLFGETNIFLSFANEIEVSQVIVIVCNIVSVSMTMSLTEDNGDAPLNITEPIQPKGNGKDVSYSFPKGTRKFIINNTDNKKEPFNRCKITILTVQDQDNEENQSENAPAIYCIMIRGAKNQLERGRELRDRT